MKTLYVIMLGDNVYSVDFDYEQTIAMQKELTDSGFENHIVEYMKKPPEYRINLKSLPLGDLLGD